jgi:hypothetical protein
MDRAGRELRCHELSRAVGLHLLAQGFSPHVVDSSLGGIDHSWIVLSGESNQVILDVYAPGRLPQVQLLHVCEPITHDYCPRTELRTDLRLEVVEDLLREMEGFAVVQLSPAESEVGSVGEHDLRRVMEVGALVPHAYVRGLQQLAGLLHGLTCSIIGDLPLPVEGELGVTRAASQEERFSVLTCGDLVAQKLTRLLKDVAELNERGIELADIAELLGAGNSPPSELHARLRSLFDRFWKPYTIVTADGVRHGVAPGDPRIIALPLRSLSIDGVREAIWREGRETSLRRRVMLRRFLLLFALSPRVLFSKEEVVRTIWEVDYHPLRHDPALFTSMMRARRVIGDSAGEVLRSVEGGYCFFPPADFLCVVESEAPGGGLTSGRSVQSLGLPT